MCTESQLSSISKAMVECYKNVYGNDIVEIVLYGSYARGDYKEDSDIDFVAVVHGSRVDLQEKLKTVWDVSAELGLENDIIVSPTVIPYDEFVKYKNKKAVIPFGERTEIVRNIKYVDSAIPQYEIDKFKTWEKIKFDILFVGDDWYETDSWKNMENRFKEVNVIVVYFPYTKGTSSTLINDILIKTRNDI